MQADRMRDNETAGGRTEDRSSTRGSIVDGPGRTRRWFLAAGAAATVASLSGCSGGGGDGGDNGDGGGGGDNTDGGDGGEGGGTTTGTTSPTDYPDEVVIGSVHPLTGSTSYVGQRLHDAVKLAATVANENGGVEAMDGATVRVLEGDHQGDPSVGGEVARELINQGADVLTGTFSSPVAGAVARVAETEQVPFVIDIGVAASILQERDLNYVYRAQPNSWSQAADHIEGLQAVAEAANIEVNTLGLYYIDTTYGQAIRDGLRRAAGNTDMEIVEETAIGFGETADSQVTSLREADPDVVVPTAFTNQMLGLVSAMKNQDYWPKVLAASASGGMNSETYKEMGSVINGELTEGYAMDPNNDRVEQVSQRYVDTYDTAPMTANVSMAFTTGELLIEAFEQAQSTDADTLNRTIADIEFGGHLMAMPPIQFDEDGENADPLSVTSQVQGMENKIVYPDRYAEADIRTDSVGDT
jgi:branched-chain amino acid transport system substrate-binding protein